MKRNAMDILIRWKESPDRKPLWITGMKHVGKTYLALEFGKSFYESSIYANFETNAQLRLFFEQKKEVLLKEEDIISILCEFFQIPIEYAGNVLFILDEVTQSKEALKALDMLMLSENNLSILVVSSESSSKDFKIDSNKFEQITLYPLQFDEFLIAKGQEWYSEVIKGHFQTNRKIPDIVHNELLTTFEEYLKVGGMPEAVNDYLSLQDTINVADIHIHLLETILSYGIKQQSEGEAYKLKQIVDTIPYQLLKDNKKFQYRMIRKGATYHMYEAILNYLVSNHYVYSNYKLHSDNVFQLYLPDVGITNSILHYNSDFVTMNEESIQKVLFDTYVIQNIIGSNYTSYFWESQSMAKINFMIETKDGFIPIEVKANESSRQKSLGVYKATYSTPYSIRISNKNFEYNNNVKHIPFYALFCLHQLNAKTS